jgi:hypothetical protein
MNRRTFLQSALAVAVASPLRAQVLTASEWGTSVLDMHLHLRPTADGNFNHISGSGVTRAVLLTNVNADAHARDIVAAYPGRFVRFASIDVTQPDAEARLRDGIRGGAIGLGEIKSRVEAAGPEMQRLYALAAELNVPITMHFQEVSQPGSPGTYNTGLKKFDAMLKAYPKTKFIATANQLDTIPGPLLDRIDLHVEVPAVKFREITSEQTGEMSAQIRERVIAARKRQQERFRDKPKITCNARISAFDICTTHNSSRKPRKSKAFPSP